MNINFGLFPPIASKEHLGKRLPSKEKKLAKKQALTTRALNDCTQWLAEKNNLFL
ncbi:hypothetical protein GCM10023260_03370 [Bartonella acomydis]|uniref:Uncharacterized protein n=1 Tax=Bartonella acomydis TaxID=686234 RepID=A0ABP9MHG8_9HYPH